LVQVTATTTVPGTVEEATTAGGSTTSIGNGQYQTVFRAYILRSNATATSVAWFAVQMTTATAGS
jgi:hypothetical protein